MPWTKITRCLPSVWKETRSLTKTVPDGGAGAGNSTDCCESGFMRLACSTDQREEKRKSQRSEPTTGKPKSGQVLVRTQGGKKGRTVVAPDRRHCNHAGSSLISSNSRAANLQRKTQKADRFWFAPGKGKTEIHQLFKGYVRSSDFSSFGSGFCIWPIGAGGRGGYPISPPRKLLVAARRPLCHCVHCCTGCTREGYSPDQVQRAHCGFFGSI